MTQSRVEAGEEQNILFGRFGLRLPVIPTHDLDQFNVYHYFNGLWHANGFNIEPYDEYGQRRDVKPQELIVPASGDKPLVAVRFAYEDTSQSGYYHRNDVISHFKEEGYFKHKVSIAPNNKVGQFESLIEVSYKEVSGGGHPDAMPIPSIYYMGKNVDRYGFNGNEARWSAKQMSQLYREILQSFVDTAS